MEVKAMTKITSNLSWGERFALIDHFQPSDSQICSVFNLTQAELDTARQLRAAGTFATVSNIDTSKYANLFSTTTTTNTSPVSTSNTKASTATIHVRPETATKKSVVKVPQKRGRKGDKIAKALQSVPQTPVPVAEFVKQHNISLAVLRQSKRFLATLSPDVAKTIGKINVRQDKTSKQLMIWREDVS